MDTGGLISFFGMISDLEHTVCSPYIFCTHSQRVAALVSQIQITVRRASLSSPRLIVIYKAYEIMNLKVLCGFCSHCQLIQGGLRCLKVTQVFLE